MNRFIFFHSHDVYHKAKALTKLYYNKLVNWGNRTVCRIPPYTT